VWTQMDAPGKVFVGFRRADPRGSPAAVATLKEIETLLDAIAREATHHK
jgi:hypothetical protein